MFAELAAECPGLRVVRIDVDADQRTAAEYGMPSMPTVILFRDGAPVLRLVGARPKRRLAEGARVSPLRTARDSRRAANSSAPAGEAPPARRAVQEHDAQPRLEATDLLGERGPGEPLARPLPRPAASSPLTLASPTASLDAGRG